MGVRSPMPDTPSLPLGADGIALLDHTSAYTTFPNGGKAAELPGRATRLSHVVRPSRRRE